MKTNSRNVKICILTFIAAICFVMATAFSGYAVSADGGSAVKPVMEEGASVRFVGEDGTLTVLPVVADPIDVIPDSGGMQEILEQANPGGPKWWIYLAIAVAAVVLVLVIVKAGSALFAARTVRRKTRK